MPTRFVGAHGSVLWWFDLDVDATVTLFMYDRPNTKAYGLLHDNGSFMFDENGMITADSWERAAALARSNSTSWIAFFHEHRVVHVSFAQSAYADGDVLLNPHPDARDVLARINDTVGDAHREDKTVKARARKRAR